MRYDVYFQSGPDKQMNENKISLCYSPQGSCGKVMFLHVSVILSTGGVWQVDPLASRQPPWTDTPLAGRHHLAGRHPLAGRDPPCRQTPPGRKTPSPPPAGRHPLAGRHLPGRHPLAGRYPPERLLQRVVRILLDCILVFIFFALI